MFKLLFFAFCMLQLSFASEIAHQHDIGEAKVLISGSRVQTELTIPAFNLLGFDYYPRTESEIQKKNALFTTLNQLPIFAFYQKKYFFKWEPVTVTLISSELRFSKPKEAIHQDIVIKQDYLLSENTEVEKMNAPFMKYLHHDAEIRVMFIDRDNSLYFELYDVNDEIRLKK